MNQALALPRDILDVYRSDRRAPAVQTLTATVPREFVHRAAVAEVFLTGWCDYDSDRFIVYAQWPRSHSFYTSIAERYDPMLAAETIRQVGALLAHAAFDVPLDRKFLMKDLTYSVTPGFLAMGTALADLELDVYCTEIKRRGEKLAGLRYTAAIRHGSDVIAEGEASYTVASPAAYQRLRGARGAADAVPAVHSVPPLPPYSVGRVQEGDVVLSGTPVTGQWMLRVDLSHPVFFDHFVDHVPGMVLLEGARQAAHLVGGDAGLLPRTIEGTFHRYTELDSPCWICVNSVDSSGEGHRVHVTGHQDGNAVFTAKVAMAPTLTPIPG